MCQNKKIRPPFAPTYSVTLPPPKCPPPLHAPNPRFSSYLGENLKVPPVEKATRIGEPRPDIYEYFFPKSLMEKFVDYVAANYIKGSTSQKSLCGICINRFEGICRICAPDSTSPNWKLDVEAYMGLIERKESND